MSILLLQIHLEHLIIGDNGPELPCKFYDIPGLDQVKTIRKEHLMKIINGELKIDVQVKIEMLHTFTLKVIPPTPRKKLVFILKKI